MRRMILAVVCALLAPGLAGAQSAGNSAEVWRTPWGDPDLQGTWTNTTTTPLERPSEFAGRSVLTDEERAELDAQAAGNRDPPTTRGSICRVAPSGRRRRIQQLLARSRGSVCTNVAGR